MWSLEVGMKCRYDGQIPCYPRYSAPLVGVRLDELNGGKTWRSSGSDWCRYSRGTYRSWKEKVHPPGPTDLVFLSCCYPLTSDQRSGILTWITSINIRDSDARALLGWVVSISSSSPKSRTPPTSASEFWVCFFFPFLWRWNYDSLVDCIVMP